MFALGISVFAALFSVVNPLGAVPVFLALTPTETVKERNKIARNTAMYFILLLAVFFVAGTAILTFFGITIDALRIAGGLVILSTGYALLNGKFADTRINKKVREEAIEKDDISFSPMAMPMLAGPGSISLLIGYWVQYPGWVDRGVILGVVALTGLTVYFILRLAPTLLRVLGVGGLKAISRIMGFLVMAIGVQLVTVGIVSLVAAVRAGM